MNTCKNCRWWGCVYEGACDRVDTVIKNPAQRFEVKAWADDDQGLETRLMTGPDFGCVHFEPKPQNPKDAQ